TVLVACIALGGAAALAYLPAYGFWALLGLTLLHAAFLAPMPVLADALALASSRRSQFEYGRVRGTGSAAFIAGVLASGQLVGGFGLPAIVVSQALLLFAAAGAAARLPDVAREKDQGSQSALALLRIPTFRNLVIVAALVLN